MLVKARMSHQLRILTNQCFQPPCTETYSSLMAERQLCRQKDPCSQFQQPHPRQAIPNINPKYMRKVRSMIPSTATTTLIAVTVKSNETNFKHQIHLI